MIRSFPHLYAGRLVNGYGFRRLLGPPSKVHSPRVRLPRSHQPQLSVNRPSRVLLFVTGLKVFS